MRYEARNTCAVPASAFNATHQYRPQQNSLPMYPEATVSDLTLAGDQGYSTFEGLTDNKPPRPAKRQRVSKEQTSGSHADKPEGYGDQMKANEGAGSTKPAGEISTAVANRPKRVRTGCLTCRERHLKCDEGLPHCQNCRKSSRVCKRGVRLNFIDTQIQSPPIISQTTDWAGMLSHNALK